MKPRVSIYTRSKRILLLSVVFFFSGLAFFYFRVSPSSFSLDNNKSVGTSQNISLKQNDQKQSGMQILKNMPEPSKFRYFVFKGEETIDLKLECREEYAVALIYSEAVDYRYDPLSAKYNTAFSCSDKNSSSFVAHTKDMNLEKGAKYYIIRADQSVSGSWYDPY